MILQNLEQCYSEITTFYDNTPCGYPIIVNIDDCKTYKEILSKIQADSNKEIVRLSQFAGNSGIPNVDAAIAASTSGDNKFLIGVSQYCMLLGKEKLENILNQLVSQPTNGKLVVLVCGCSSILRIIENNDIRLDRRIITLNEKELQLPKIYLSNSQEECYGQKYYTEVAGLIDCLESMKYYSDSKINEIIVVTKFKQSVFSQSMYSIHQYGGAFEAICRDYPSVKSALEKKWGSEKQWEDFYKSIKTHRTLSHLIEAEISATVNLSSFISDRFEDIKSREAWYLWIAMKTMGTKENQYLSIVLEHSDSVEALLENIFMELLNHNVSENNFTKLYNERKNLVDKLSDKTDLIKKYCDHVGQCEKDAVWYLTDLSDKERLRFLVFINKYEYTREEIMNITKVAFPELYYYLSKFSFTSNNTVIPSKDPEMHSELTDYFEEYKIQKLENRIHPAFLDKVNKYAVDRPFYKLSPRISIISDIDKTDTQIHFFDALGVEYLSYILYKCSKYDLQTRVHIGYCQLPSITRENLEFKKFFKTVINSDGFEELPGTKELDELKHHSKTIDYTKRPEPIHLFEELEIIDRELRSIREMLISQKFSKILIVSDHGASRLSVIYGKESTIPTPHTGETKNSGRCMKIDTNPEVPEAAYENGYAVLANYDRFKGGRKANVEVHGGATLEETVVPIIEITKKPADEDIHIVHDNIEFHNKEIVSLTIYSNIALNSPTIVIHELGDAIYNCSGIIDDTHYKFEIPEIKRTSSFTLDLYDDNKLKKENMPFKARKASVTTKDFF